MPILLHRKRRIEGAPAQFKHKDDVENGRVFSLIHFIASENDDMAGD
jgi:hypothetical protein